MITDRSFLNTIAAFVAVLPNLTFVNIVRNEFVEITFSAINVCGGSKTFRSRSKENDAAETYHKDRSNLIRNSVDNFLKKNTGTAVFVYHYKSVAIIKREGEPKSKIV